MKDWAGLVHVEVVSGTAMDGSEEEPEGFRGFVTVRAVAEDGSFMSGQLDVDEVRGMAMNFLEAAEAAETDAAVMKVLTGAVGLPVHASAQLVRELRDARGG